MRYDGLTGYSVSNYFATIAITDGASSNGPAVVSGTGGDGVNLRDAPDIASGILTALEEDTAVQLLDGPVTGPAGDPWYQVEAFGASGWMIGDYLDPGGTNVVGDAIVAEALAYLGTPYRWAGTTPEGFDCSGFTWFVVSNVVDGDFPRPNEDQVVSGEYVAPDALLPGDLIFFQNTYQWGLSHVGIYLGDGQMISATGQYDAVGISSLDDPYWSARYLTARRIR